MKSPCTFGYQVELRYVGWNILNQINFIYIFITLAWLVDQQLVPSLYIELTVSDLGLKLKSVVFAIPVDIQEERRLNKLKAILIKVKISHWEYNNVNY